jgi:hypothetical protein
MSKCADYRTLEWYISRVWMTEWVRLREARKREFALKDREREEADRPYLIRLQVLTKLRDEADVAAKSFDAISRGRLLYASGKWQAWKTQAITAIGEILGEFHPLLKEMDDLWNYELPEDRYSQAQFENRHWFQATGILNAAIASYTFMNIKIQDSTIANTLDPDLLTRVDHVFRVEDWTAVASLAATYVEDRFRIWAGLDQSAFGVNLMTKVLHPETGVFPLGTVTGEREGWHQLGRGFMSACSNVDRHRIQSRDDLRRYAVGVLGAASLLLTQMRHQHGNRFLGQ